MARIKEIFEAGRDNAYPARPTMSCLSCVVTTIPAGTTRMSLGLKRATDALTDGTLTTTTPAG